MRIVLCAEFPLAEDRVVGGIEDVSRGLARAMARRDGLEVHVVSFHAGLEGARTDEVAGVSVHRFPLPRRFGNLSFGATERRATARKVRSLAPDVVHALGMGPKALGAADSGAPWVVSVNGIQSNEARVAGGARNRVRAWAFTRMEDATLRRASDVIVPNARVAEMMGDRLGCARVHRIENAVDESFFALTPRREPGRIICVGRILPLKAPEDLIEAVSRLKNLGARARVRFVGPADDARYLAELRARVAGLGLGEQVEFLGFLSDAELQSELEAAQVLVHPSRVEVAPLSVMQAMAAGLPVIATDVGGTRHLVEDHRTGRLVPPARPDLLAKALDDLLRDPEAAGASGRAGRAEAEARFRIDAVVDRTLDVYRGLPDAVARSESTGSRSRNPIEYQGIAPNPRTPGGRP